MSIVLVVHIDCPDSIEAYFQEAGRAGRDGRRSYAVLLYNGADKRKLEKRITDTFPSKDYIRQVYEHLAFFYQIGVGSGYNHTFEFNIDKLEPEWSVGLLTTLAEGLLPDGSKNAAYASAADLDSNGVPDWWQETRSWRSMILFSLVRR